MAKNQPNKFQEFEQKYAYYSTANQGLEGAKKSSSACLSQDTRNLATAIIEQEMPEDTREKLNNKLAVFDLINTTKDQKTIITTLGYWTGVIKQDVNTLAQGNLESILSSAPEDYVDFALRLVKPKESYSGSNARVYAEIAGLQKEIGDMAKANPEKIKEIVNAKLKSEYGTSEKDQKALGLINALMAVNQDFIVLKYQKLVTAKQEDYASKLEGKKAGYLAANLQGTDFVDFYGKSLQAMADYQKQAERQAETGSRRQRRRHPEE